MGYATGVSASIGGIMLAKGEIKKKGVMPPEDCIQPRKFFNELEKRGIPIHEVIETRRKIKE
jgi:saccharopine dehydrogenase-like NADP-dependent oxidoreductase